MVLEYTRVGPMQPYRVCTKHNGCDDEPRSVWTNESIFTRGDTFVKTINSYS